MGKQNRNKRKCPLCRKTVKRMTPHLKLVHKETPFRAVLLSNYARLDGKIKNGKRHYKVCPIEQCPSIGLDMPLHLRHAHAMSRKSSLIYSAKALRVVQYDFDLENEAENENTGQAREDILGDVDSDEEMASQESQPAEGSADETESSGDESSGDKCSGDKGKEACNKPKRVEKTKTGFFSQYKEFLSSDSGGALAPSRAQERVSLVYRFFKHFNMVDKISKWHTCLKSTTVQSFFNDESNVKKSPHWRWNFVTYTRQFARYLKQNGIISPKMEDRFRDEMKYLTKTIYKKIRNYTAVAGLKKHRLIKKVDISRYTNSLPMRKAISRLRDGQGLSEPINLSHLIGSMIVNSGIRAGGLGNLRREEVANAVRVQEYKVVSISEHKTSIAGPYQIPLSLDQYRALETITKWSTERHPESNYVFLTINGNRFTASRISYEFSKSWRATGCLAAYGKFTPTDQRKYFVSHIIGQFPDMRESLSNQLRHGQGVEKQFYDLSVNEQRSVHVLQKLNEAVNNTFNDPEEETPIAHPIPNQDIRTENWVKDTVQFPSTSTSSPRQHAEPPIAHPITNPDIRTEKFPSTSTSSARQQAEPLKAHPIQNQEIDTSDRVKETIKASITSTLSARRSWSGEQNLQFKNDFKDLIKEAQTSKKKSTVGPIREVLENQEIGQRWRHLSVANIKDKIWTIYLQSLKQTE